MRLPSMRGVVASIAAAIAPCVGDRQRQPCDGGREEEFQDRLVVKMRFSADYMKMAADHKL